MQNWKNMYYFSWIWHIFTHIFVSTIVLFLFHTLHMLKLFSISNFLPERCILFKPYFWVFLTRGGEVLGQWHSGNQMYFRSRSLFWSWWNNTAATADSYWLVQDLVKSHILQYSLVQCNVIQCQIAQCSVVQYSVIQCNIVRYSVVQCNVIQCIAV